MKFLAEFVIAGICIVVRIAQLCTIKPLLNSADNSYSIKTKVVSECLKKRRYIKEGGYGLAYKKDNVLECHQEENGSLHTYTFVKQNADLVIKVESFIAEDIQNEETENYATKEIINLFPIKKIRQFANKKSGKREGIDYATIDLNDDSSIVKFVKWMQSPEREPIYRFLFSPLLWQWPKESDHYITITTTRLGILAIQNAVYHQFVCLLLMLELFVISASLHFGTPYIDPLHKVVKAVNIVTAISLVADSIIHTLIQQQLAGPIISNSLDSCLQRCNYHYGKVKEQANRRKRELLDEKMWEERMKTAKWHEIVWITNKLHPKRKEWSKNSQFGIQYCQAIDSADDAYAGFDTANKGQIAAMIAISSQILLIIIITSTGLGREKSLQIVSSSAVVVFSTASAGGIATNAVNKAAACSAAKKARRLITAINGGFCSINIKEILKDVFNVSSFTKMLLFAVTAALVPHQSFSAVQPRKESTVGYCFSNDLESHHCFQGIIPKIQRTSAV